MPRNNRKQDLFTEEMGKNIFVFPPTKREDSSSRHWTEKKPNRGKIFYSEIPLKNLETAYKATFGKRISIGLSDQK